MQEHQTSDNPGKQGRTPRTVVVRGSIGDGFRVSVDADGHQLLADEPVDYGGTDLGPSPYQYLSVALASCTAMTLNLFARREDLPLESVEVEVWHKRIHADDCADCSAKSGFVDRFQQRVTLTGDLDEEQRALLLKIAGRCPVHKTLHSEVSILTELVDDS